MDSVVLRTGCIATLTAALVGCATVNYDASLLASAKNQIASAALVGDAGETLYSGASKEILDGSLALQPLTTVRSFVDNCQTGNQALTDAGFVPVTAAIIQLIYELSADRAKRKLEGIKKASSSTYGVEFILPKGNIHKYRCLVVLRHNKKHDVKAIFAFRLNIINEVLSIQPVYSWAANTTATTREVKDTEKETISILVGFSLQGIGKQENGLPILASSGQDAKKVGKLKLGDDISKSSEGVSIGPVPLVDESPITVFKIAITEVGDIGFSIDERLAINKTIREAIGPALSAGAKAYLEEE